jgi:proteasome accessory factor C
MAKELSAPLLRTARLLDLVPYLNSHQGISIEDLAREFGVTSTQINSDLTTLWMCGLPGYTPLELMDLEFESGFVTIRNATTLNKPRNISFDEGLALLLGLELLQQAIPVQRVDLLTEIGKLSDRLSEKIGVPRVTNTSQVINPEILHSLLSAKDLSETVEISYHSLYSDEITERMISPLTVYEENGSNYLRAYCFKAKDIRIFRIDRVLNLTNIGKSEMATTPEAGTIYADLDVEVGKIAYLLQINVVSRDLVERFNLNNRLGVDDQKVGKIVELTSFSHEWILRAVCATAGDVELKTPSDIRDEIAKSAQKILDRYSQNKSL